MSFRTSFLLGIVLGVCALAVPAAAAIQVALLPSVTTPFPVGTTVVWTALASDTDPGTLDYRFSVREVNGVFRVRRDFHPLPIWDWASLDPEGNYEVEVTVRNRETLETAQEIVPFTVRPRSIFGLPVISPTSNPLVALYSGPVCPAGSFMRVQFSPVVGLPRYTPLKPCDPGRTMNFYIAGMKANTLYNMRYEVVTGSDIVQGPTRAYITGSLPWWLPFPSSRVWLPPNSGTCLGEGVLLHSNIDAFIPSVNIATDLYGEVIWYAHRQVFKGASIFRPLPGGNMLLTMIDTSNPVEFLNEDQIFREIDLAGNIVRETNATRVSEQLEALGYSPITSFHHDAIRLPNGHTVAIASAEHLVTDLYAPGEVDVTGDMLVDLDENFQVTWAWDSFEQLDLSRRAILGETCTNQTPGCPPIFLAAEAQDWTHSNSVHYTPEDGNLLLSMRHQDWVIKIDYNNGSGTGAVVWRLGDGGDFTIKSQDPFPWFSHQHDAEFDIPGVPILSLFDNGNTRRALDPTANSRGQALLLDEDQFTATPVLNADLGGYSMALGSAERLCNGNYHFDLGVTTPTLKARSIEVKPNGLPNYLLESSTQAYRTFRMLSLYEP